MVARNMVTLTGRLGTAEEWSVRWNYGPGGGPGGLIESTGDLNTWAIGIAAGLPGMFPGSGEPLTVFLSSAGTIDSVRCDYLDAANVVQASGAAPVVVAGANPVTKAYQTAVVFSLRTALPGASHRGRTYFPALGATIESPAGTISASIRSAALEQFIDILNMIEAAQPTPGDVRLGVASETLNVVTPVTSIQIGSFLDTQRRRRNGLVETYTTEPFPA